MDTKKRNRIPASCSVCRRRKSKCDRVKPVCGSCKKKSIAHLCFYETDSDIDRKSPDESTPRVNSPSQYSHGNSSSNHSQGHTHTHSHGNTNTHLPSDSSVYNPDFDTSTSTYTNQSQSGNPPPRIKSTYSQIDLHAPPPHSIIQGDTSQEVSPFNQSPGAYPYPSNVYTGNYGHSIAPPPPAPMPANIPLPRSQSIPRLNHDESHPPPHPSHPPHHPPPPSSMASSINAGGMSVSGVSHTSAPTHHSGDHSSDISPGSNPNSQSNDTNGRGSFAFENSPYNGSSFAGGNIQLPPIKNSGSTNPDGGSLVVVSIGPNSTLQLNPNDHIDGFFSNASFPLSLEGPYLQNHGFISYVGITKSDRFIKFFRRFAVELLKKGEISQFVPKAKRKRTSNASSPPDTPNGPRKKRSNLSTANNSPNQQQKSPLNEEVNPDSSSVAGSKTDDPEIKLETNKELKVEDEKDIINDKEQKQQPVDEMEEEDDEEEEEEEEEEEDAGFPNKTDVDDEEDILVITRINVAKENNMKKTKTSNDHILQPLLPGLKTLYSPHNSRKEYYKIVEQAVLKILPSKRSSLTAFSRFFKYIHPFVPIVNEGVFLLDVNQVFDNFPDFESGKRFESISIKNDKHLTIVAMLLLITRLGYLSLIHNDSENNQYNANDAEVVEEAKSVSFKIFTDVINLCLPDEHTSRRSSFRLVQALTLLHFYRQVAPNDCHGVGSADSQILFGTIIRHALSIGLNRDPLRYEDHETINKNEALIDTWRHLWYYLVVNDANFAIHRFSILDIYNSNIGDVKLPKLFGKTGELPGVYKAMEQISNHYRNLMILMSNFKQKPKIIDILAESNKLEHIFFNFFGKDFFKDSICKPATDGTADSKSHEESYLKVIKYITFIQLRTNLSSIYYVIALHYEKEYNEVQTGSMNAGIELFKIHFKSVVQLVYIMSYVFDNSVQLFGKNYDYILTAMNERFMIKTHSFLTAFFIRLIHQKQILTLRSYEKSNMERLLAINRLFNMILVEAELFVGNFRKLSLRYVNSYKIYVLTYYVLKQCMENAEVFFTYAVSDTVMMDATNMLQFFTADEINYLCRLCEEFRVAKNTQYKQRRVNNFFGFDSSAMGVYKESEQNGGETVNGETVNGETVNGSDSSGVHGVHGTNGTHRTNANTPNGPGTNNPSQTQSQPPGTESFSINQLNPMNELSKNLFKMHKNDNSHTNNSPFVHDPSTYQPDLTEFHEGISNDDFFRLFEIYDLNQSHLE